MKNNRSGFTIIVVIGIMLISLIMLEGLVLWLQNESKWTVKYSRSTRAFHLAEAGVDRGMWKLKSSTGTWEQAATGVVIAGYDFDKTYDDISGGQYRIQFSSGPGENTVTIIAEGRDLSTKEVRAIQVIYENKAIQAAVIAAGIVTWSNKFAVQWGPVMAQGNIDIDSTASQEYYPRKFSRQVVSCSNKGNERDLNGLDPPNTDNEEWWSDYEVPDMPVINFAALRTSAGATATLNVYGCKSTGAAWVGGAKCKGGSGDHSDDFQDAGSHGDSKKNYIWYWDNSVEFTGTTGAEGIGIYGTIIVRGNLRIGDNVDDNYSYTGDVPDDAWEEYTKITKTTGDTAAVNEYPADAGYQTNNATFDFGSETWTAKVKAADTDIGFRGFVYVGGDLVIDGPCDFNGGTWVVGDVTKSPGIGRSYVFFDSAITIPTLNVILSMESWVEIQADKETAWL